MKYEKLMIAFTVIYFAAIYSDSANANPVYLSCTISSKEKVTHMEITLDESNQQVGYLIVETGFTEKLTGVFAADKVIFVSDSRKLTEMHVEINRNDLSIIRSFPGLNDGVGIDKSESGKCSIVQTSKNRKF